MNTIAKIFFSGEVYGPKDFQIWTKKMWFEHVKRRPELNAKHNLGYSFTPEELKIINTPLKQLLQEFEESITN